MTALTKLQIRELHKYMQEHIIHLWQTEEDINPFYIEFARAIERAHGIDQ